MRDGRTALGSTDCERIRPGVVAQPVNAATSLAFVAAAEAVRRFAPRPGVRRREALVYAGLLALVGAGSISFHGSQPRGAELLHDAPIAGLLLVTVATPTVRRMRRVRALPGWSRRRGLAMAGVGAAAAVAYAGGRTTSRTCRPDSVVQLHGVWHLLAATEFLLVARLLYDDPGSARRGAVSLAVGAAGRRDLRV